MKIEFVVDRIEGGTAVCEELDDSCARVNVPVSEITGSAAREGDVLTFDGVGYAVDTLRTEQRRREIMKKFFGE